MVVTDRWIKSSDEGDVGNGLEDVAMDLTLVTTKKQSIARRLIQHLVSLLELPEDIALELEKYMVCGTTLQFKEGEENSGSVNHGHSGSGCPQTSGSLAIPGENIPCRICQDSATKFHGGKNHLALEVILRSLTVHWLWQQQEDSTNSSPAGSLSCLMTVVAKGGFVRLRQHNDSKDPARLLSDHDIKLPPPTDSSSTLPTRPSINLQGIQISLEQQVQEEEKEEETSYTRLFVKFDEVYWFQAGQIRQLNLANVTFSGSLAISTIANRMMIQQALLTCPQTTIFANFTPIDTPSMTKTSKTVKMVDLITTRNADRDNHVFLSALLKVFNTIDLPHSTISNRVPVIVTMATDDGDNRSSDFYQQKGFLPPFGTPSPTTTSLGDLVRHLYLHMQDAASSIAEAAAKNIYCSDASRTRSSEEHHIYGKDRDKKIFGFALGDSLAATAGLVATGASIVTPIGAAVSVAAVGVKDGVVAAAETGKRARGAATGHGYRFGDVTRGVVATVQQRRQERQEHGGSIDRQCSNNHQSYLRQNKGRYAGVVGGSVGSAVGLSLVGGPIGLVAGTLLGSHATQTQLAKREEREARQVAESDEGNQSHEDLSFSNDLTNTDDLIVQQLNRPGLRESQPLVRSQRPSRGGDGNPSAAAAATNSTTIAYHEQQHQRQYGLGDSIRGVIARGKTADGRDSGSDYKFGDFARGLFASSKRMSDSRKS